MDDANDRPRERSDRRSSPDRASGDRPPGGRGGPGGDRGGPGGDRPAPRSRFGGRDEGGGAAGGRPRPGGRFGGRRRREPVFFDNEVVDYKDLARLRRCIDERGKIVGRRKTGNSAKVQRKVTIAIKRARHMALLPFEVRDARR
jgi:small subunit ribosomal protein S18